MQAFILIFRRLASLTVPMHAPKVTAYGPSKKDSERNGKNRKIMTAPSRH